MVHIDNFIDIFVVNTFEFDINFNEFGYGESTCSVNWFGTKVYYYMRPHRILKRLHFRVGAGPITKKERL